jgi:hypothetical protein
MACKYHRSDFNHYRRSAGGVKLAFIQPGKTTQNAYIESFNGRFRDECLNDLWFSPCMKHAF